MRVKKRYIPIGSLPGPQYFFLARPANTPIEANSRAIRAAEHFSGGILVHPLSGVVASAIDTLFDTLEPTRHPVSGKILLPMDPDLRVRPATKPPRPKRGKKRQ